MGIVMGIHHLANSSRPIMLGASGVTIPARLARATLMSPNWDVARARSRAMYRDWYRSAPEIVQLYALNIPASAVRAKIRQRFNRNAGVDDIETVDMLLHKSQQDYQETMNMFKMESHIMRWFTEEELPARPNAFLDAFYESRDDPNAVTPTAWVPLLHLTSP